MNINIFWDMDGTLFERVPREDCDYNNGPKLAEFGYFLRRATDDAAWKMVREFDALSKVKQAVCSHIFLLKQHQMFRIRLDKRFKLWCLEFPGEVLFCDHNVLKSDTVERYLERKLNPFDILIDDFNGNLEEWTNAGGNSY